MAIEPSSDNLPPGEPTELGWMLSCSGVHPEAVKIVESLQAEVKRLRINYEAEKARALEYAHGWERDRAEAERLRQALEEIAKLDADDADPGYEASPDYWVGVGSASDIAKEALDG